MDGDMQSQVLVFGVLILGAWFQAGHSTAAQLPTAAVKAGTKEYCNQTYMYCLELPSVGTVEPHLGDSPNHGVSIKLPADEGVVWSYAHWDAALLKSARQALTARIGLLIVEHPNAEIRIKPTKLARLPAFLITLAGEDNAPSRQVILVAYRAPQEESEGPGIIYEIGINCHGDACTDRIGDFEQVARTFRISPNH